MRCFSAYRLNVDINFYGCVGNPVGLFSVFFKQGGRNETTDGWTETSCHRPLDHEKKGWPVITDHHMGDSLDFFASVTSRNKKGFLV